MLRRDVPKSSTEKVPGNDTIAVLDWLRTARGIDLANLAAGRFVQSVLIRVAPPRYALAEVEGAMERARRSAACNHSQPSYADLALATVSSTLTPASLAS